MKRAIALFMALAVMMALFPCWAFAEGKAETPDPTPSPVPLDAEITLTIPAKLIGDVTAEQIETSRQEKGYKSATLNSDGSVTYVMTEKQRQELEAEVKKQIDEQLDEILSSGDYPRFLSIEANEDYTGFKVYVSTDSLNFMELFSAPTFYMLGGLFNAYTGRDAENIHVDYINQETGAVINEANSSKMGASK